MSYIGTYMARTQNVRLLDGAIRNKTRRRQRHASIAIVGFRQTGKKTLARRFHCIQNPSEVEVPTRYYYRAYVDLDTRRTNGTGDVFLTSYVIPPPLDLPEVEPPLHYKETYNFSTIIFLCSVIDIATFEVIVERIYELMEFYRNEMPHFLIVGNKMDLSRNLYPNYLTFTHATETTKSHFGVNYEECSAKKNRNVDIILEEILLQVIAEQP